MYIQYRSPVERWDICCVCNVADVAVEGDGIVDDKSGQTMINGWVSVAEHHRLIVSDLIPCQMEIPMGSASAVHYILESDWNSNCTTNEPRCILLYNVVMNAVARPHSSGSL